MTPRRPAGRPPSRPETLPSIGKPSWTDQEIRDALRRVQGTLALEGFSLTPADEELIARALKGEITEEEFTRLALEAART
jgi:hypothetical protein